MIKRGVNCEKNTLHFIKQIQTEYIRAFKKNNNQAYLILENKDENFDYIINKTIRQIENLL
ncbi:MAG: hypothetical protein P1P85_02075 [Patescibacteria group bacterium]|nr:hypothetical protein [Patescibacteria group bacterium]